MLQFGVGKEELRGEEGMQGITMNMKEMLILTPSASLLCLLGSALLVNAADKHSKILLPNDLSVGKI